MRRGLYYSLAVAVGCIIPCSSARTPQRLHFAPRFVKGQILRYRIDTHTSSDEHNVTPIVNPEGASEYKQSTDLVLRFDVLRVQRPSPGAPEAVRFRATFEQAHSDSEENAYAPTAAALDHAIDELKGRSFEFSVDSGNELADIQGLARVASDRDTTGRVLSWIHVLFAPIQIPRGGVAVGQKWTTEHQLAGMPLKGLLWRNESTYLRNEPCASSSAMHARCAVFLTRFSILQRGSDHSDRTPESYLHNGLRTSGKWTGSGESLDCLFLAGGLLVSSTQSARQEMDYQIRSAASGSAIQHIGRISTQTEITLLSRAAPERVSLLSERCRDAPLFWACGIMAFCAVPAFGQRVSCGHDFHTGQHIRTAR